MVDYFELTLTFVIKVKDEQYLVDCYERNDELGSDRGYSLLTQYDV